MSTSSRMLRLLSLLQTHRYWSGGELAERLEVTERTLRRDVERLRDLGYPVSASPGVGGGYQLEAGSTLPPLLVDDEEAIAIAVGLRTAAGGAVAGAEEVSVRALAKVVRMLPPRLRRRADALAAATVPVVFGGGPTVDAEALSVLSGAVQDTERVRFEYESREGVASSRHAEPNRLVTVGRRWYLVAWDIDRADWRTFRVDRLRDPRSTRWRFTPREVPGGDAADYVRTQLASFATRYEVEAIVDRPAEEVASILGTWASVTAVDERSCRVTMSAEAIEWPALALAGLGAPFRVVAPPELRVFMADAGRRFLAASEA